MERSKRDLTPEPLESNLNVLLSIGTGGPSIRPFETHLKGIGTSLARIAAETCHTAENFHRAHSTLGDANRYYRFNVPNGLQDVDFEDASRRGEVMRVTESYVQSQDIFKAIQQCVGKLAQRESGYILAQQLISYLEYHNDEDPS